MVREPHLYRCGFFICNKTAFLYIIGMLVYTVGTQSDTIVTLNESKTITNPYYLFVFTNVSTKVQLTKIVNSADDVSDYPERCNIFQFNTITLFASQQAGDWYYEVYEQVSSINTDPTGLNMVECGKMKLKPTTTLTREGYAPNTTYKGYAG